MKDLSVDFSTKGQDLLKKIESLRLNPYDDQTGKDISAWVKGATIGYGHLILQNEWDVYKKWYYQRASGSLVC